MAVYKARGDHPAACVEGLLASPLHPPDLSYDAVLDPHIAVEPGVSGSVHDPSILYGQIQHACPLLQLSASRDYNPLASAGLVHEADLVVEVYRATDVIGNYPDGLPYSEVVVTRDAKHPVLLRQPLQNGIRMVYDLPKPLEVQGFPVWRHVGGEGLAATVYDRQVFGRPANDGHDNGGGAFFRRASPQPRLHSVVEDVGTRPDLRHPLYLSREGGRGRGAQADVLYVYPLFPDLLG